MKNVELNQRIDSALSHCTPNVLDAVLSECTEQERRIITMTKTNSKPRKNVLAIVCASAAAVVLILSGVFGLGYYNSNIKVDSTVGFDVNPSIELDINKREKVISANALNEDADKVLGDMELKGSDIEVAINAIVGSMLKNGYINELQNSLLISVNNDDAEKSRQLEEELMKTVNETLQQSSVNASLIGQTVTADDQLNQLAQQYGISVGKAQLIQDIIASNPTYTFDSLAGLSVNELNLLISSNKVSVENVTTSGNASTKAYIESSKALEIACAHANAPVNDVRNTEVEFDYDDGRMVYDVEFDYNGIEYDYDIDAVSGEIVKSDKDRDDDYRANSNQNNAPASSNQNNAAANNSANQDKISSSEAKSIAFKHAGISSSDVRDLSCELDRENGKLIYEVDFDSNGYEYEYDIDAANGNILKNRKEKDDDYRGNVSKYNVASSKTTSQTASKPAAESSKSAETSKPATETSSNQTTTTDKISSSEAKSIAFKHAGVSSSNVRDLSCELDRDDGRLIYEVDFDCNGYEYEYDIDAVSGKILKSEKDRDD